MASQIPFDEEQELGDSSLDSSIRDMTCEQLLSVWEQSQKIYYAVQSALLPEAVSGANGTDMRIAIELMRRSVEGAGPVPDAQAHTELRPDSGRNQGQTR
ncbi:MAG: hypothetical protein Q4F72_06390 [Desulfovibrionaceae bacterium]|nr:hypothetical protein [Desulfovibrionaceae bacterium]